MSPPLSCSDTVAPAGKPETVPPTVNVVVAGVVGAVVVDEPPPPPPQAVSTKRIKGVVIFAIVCIFLPMCYCWLIR